MHKISVDTYNRIYDLYAKTLYRYVYTYTKNKEDSEDIIQDSFLCLLNKKISFKDDKEYLYYLIKVSRNKALDFLKVRKRETYSDDILNNETTINQEYDNDNLTKLLGLIEELEPIYKDVIVLYYNNDLKIEEISKVLKISVSAIKMRLKRAREILSNKMIGENI